MIDGDVSGVMVHDQTNRGLAHMLVEMPFGAYPMALGVIFDDPAPTFDSAIVTQNAQASEGKKADLQKLLSLGQTWQVEKPAAGGVIHRPHPAAASPLSPSPDAGGKGPPAAGSGKAEGEDDSDER